MVAGITVRQARAAVAGRDGALSKAGTEPAHEGASPGNPGYRDNLVGNNPVLYPADAESTLVEQLGWRPRMPQERVPTTSRNNRSACQTGRPIAAARPLN